MMTAEQMRRLKSGRKAAGEVRLAPRHLGAQKLSLEAWRLTHEYADARAGAACQLHRTSAMHNNCCDALCNMRLVTGTKPSYVPPV
jgi:hypothetical protein